MNQIRDVDTSAAFSNVHLNNQDTNCLSVERFILEEITAFFKILNESLHSLPCSLVYLSKVSYDLTVGMTAASLDCRESNIYYATSCAVYFLRLLCPAIISPLEWGALKKDKIEYLKAGFRHIPSTFTTESLPQIPRDVVDTSFRLNIYSWTKSLRLKDKEPDKIEYSIADNRSYGAMILMAHLIHHSFSANCIHPSLVDTIGLELLSAARDVAINVSLEMSKLFSDHLKESCRSIVDPSTKAAFDSAIVKKALIQFAKMVQCVANASCIGPQNIESHVAEAQLKLSNEAGYRRDHLNCNETKSRVALEELSDEETKLALMIIENCKSVRQLYLQLPQQLTLNIET